jgi:hypothetical protein
VIKLGALNGVPRATWEEVKVWLEVSPWQSPDQLPSLSGVYAVLGPHDHPSDLEGSSSGPSFAYYHQDTGRWSCRYDSVALASQCRDCLSHPYKRWWLGLTEASFNRVVQSIAQGA